MQQHVDNMEFSLKGKPWTPGEEGRHDGIHARSMLCHLISALASRGWHAVVAADVSARHADDDDSRYDPVDVDSIYFMYDPAAPPLAPPLQVPYPAPYGIPQQDAPPPSFDAPSYESLS